MPYSRTLSALALFVAGALRAAQPISVAQLNERAARANAVLTVPGWPQTPEAIATLMETALAAGTGEVDRIAQVERGHLTLQNTAAAFDYACWQTQNAANVATVILGTTADERMHAAADAALKRFAEWQARNEHRADVYRRVRELKDSHPQLSGEDKRLVDDLLREFHREGVDLYPESADAIAKLRGQLAQLTSEFDANIVAASAPLVFTGAELEGMPEGFLASPDVKTGDDQFTVAANVMWQFNTVEENARRKETRRKVQIAHDDLAKGKNVPLLNRILAVRNDIALRLGYRSWADYRTEAQMAKNSATAERFIDNLATGLQPKFAAEVSQLQKMKAADTGDPHTPIAVWDWRYYANQLNKQKFAIDSEELRNFFPFERVRDGMLAIYSRIFGLHFDEVVPPQKWTDRLQLYAVSDSSSGEPLGLLYLDLFTYDGKTNVGGTSDIIGGKLLPDGRRQCPVAGIFLNFAPANGDTPALLAHDQVEMLFHEFGHALHTVVSRAKYARFAGTNVPRDFVEAPSQMLQNWVWDKRVLETFAADYRDPEQKIPAEVVEKMKQAKRATAAIFYRRQCAFAQMDLALHGVHKRDQPYDCAALSNSILEKTFLPIDRSTALVASFRGMNGYDAAYYGYAWSDAIAADMATAFEKSRDGFLDATVGKRLRREVYEAGNSRDVNLSVEKFLGRRFSSRPFLQKLGIGRN